MSDEIFVDELDCPHCDWIMFNESDIEIDPYKQCKTTVLCDGCGRDFMVTTNLTISVSKE